MVVNCAHTAKWEEQGSYTAMRWGASRELQKLYLLKETGPLLMDFETILCSMLLLLCCSDMGLHRSFPSHDTMHCGFLLLLIQNSKRSTYNRYFDTQIMTRLIIKKMIYIFK